MMHPELMHIIVAQYHKDLQDLSKPGPVVSPFAEARHAARIELGRALVRLGHLLGGESPRMTPIRDLASGKPA